MNKTKKLSIVVAILATAGVLLGFLFRSEIKEKIESISNPPAVVEEDTTQPEAQAIEFVF